MRCVVRAIEGDTLYGLMECPEDERGLVVEKDAYIVEDLIANSLWPQGEERPRLVTCRSKSGPHHYRVFRSTDPYDVGAYEPVPFRVGRPMDQHGWAEHVACSPEILKYRDA